MMTTEHPPMEESATSANRELMPAAEASGFEHKTFRITATRTELDNFLHLIEYIPDLSAKESALAPSETPDRQSFGQFDLISILVEFSLAISAHASWDTLKSRIDRFREGRRHFIIEEVVIVQYDQLEAAAADPDSRTSEGDEPRAAAE
jgi:hypothetical protein